MPEVPHFGGRAPKTLELREGGRERGLACDDAGANATVWAPGTIRGELALSISGNLLHGTDSPESAERDVPVWFADVELV
jgi:nucleoside-diphosphate kinase